MITADKRVFFTLAKISQNIFKTDIDVISLKAPDVVPPASRN
jgi:hypothetical protein